jgi:hypothetical protein
MITNEEQLAQAIEQLERMYRAVLVLRAEALPRSRDQYALMAEGPLTRIMHDVPGRGTGRAGTARPVEPQKRESWGRFQPYA